MNATTDGARMITEEIQVAGGELLERIRTLINEGRVRHIKVKSPKGDTYFEVPLAVGVVGGAALAFASPFLAMAAAIAGMMSSFKIEIVRDGGAPKAIEGGAKATQAAPGKARTRRGKSEAPPKRVAAKAMSRPPVKAKRSAAPGAKPPLKRSKTRTAGRR